MAIHSALTAPIIEAVEASGPGALSGFQVSCPACGLVFRTSLRGIAEQDAREHVAYMIRKEDAEAPDPRFLQALRDLEEIVAANPHLRWGSK